MMNSLRKVPVTAGRRHGWTGPSRSRTRRAPQSCLPIPTAGRHAASRRTAPLRPLRLATGAHRTVEKRALRTFVYTPQTGEGIRRTLRSRFARSPYTLRAYFDTQLPIAKSKGTAHALACSLGGTREAQDKIITKRTRCLRCCLGSESPLRSEELPDWGMRDSRKPNVCRTTCRGCTIVQNATPGQLDPVLEAPRRTDSIRSGLRR